MKYTLVATWMLVIFMFSSQPHDTSTTQSTGVINIVQQVSGFAPSEVVVRKSAHAFLYFILGLLVANAVYTRGSSWRRNFATSATIVIIYAMSDELHQMFVSGRAGLWSDIVIDSIAGLVGIYVSISLLHHIFTKVK